MKIFLGILSVFVVSSNFAYADNILLSCGKVDKRTHRAQVVFSSTAGVNPSPEDLEFTNLIYNNKKIDLAQVKANIKNYNLHGYTMAQKQLQKGNDIPHLVFEFKDLEKCTDESSGEVAVKRVGGLAGTLPVETIKGCTCDVD